MPIASSTASAPGTAFTAPASSSISAPPPSSTCSSKNGEFLGGAIAPGLGISADALFNRAAKLPRVDIRKPAKVVGTGTVDNMQIGLYYGYIGLVDGILERMLPTLDPATTVLATGGLARLIADGSKYIKQVDDLLTLTGLRLLYERNRR